MTKQLEAHIAELQKVIDGPNGKYWAHEPAVSPLIAALEQSQQESKVQLKTIASVTELWNENRQRIAELEASHKKLRECLAGIHNTITRDGAYTSLAAILSAAKRAHEESATIAPVEASQLAVNLRKYDVGEVMHVSGFSRDYAEGWCAGNDNAIVEIRAAGGTVYWDE